MIVNLTQKQIENIQLGAGVVYINYGENDQRLLAPTRGGGEFTVTNTIRNIEHDGADGSEAGMQVIEKQEAVLKVTTLEQSIENISLSIPGCVTESDGSITNGNNGIIPESNYIKNVTMLTENAGGKYQKIALYKAMHEGALAIKAVPKAEGELSLEFSAHFNPQNKTEKLWRITPLEKLPSIPVAEGETTNA